MINCSGKKNVTYLVYTSHNYFVKMDNFGGIDYLTSAMPSQYPIS